MRATWYWITGALCFAGWGVVIGCSGGDALGPEHLAGGTTSGSGASGQTSASIAVASTSNGSGAGFVCDPPAAAGSIYELAAPLYHMPTNPTSLCEYRGEVMLIVNTAAL